MSGDMQDAYEVMQIEKEMNKSLSNNEKSLEEGYDYVKSPCCGAKVDLTFNDQRYMSCGKTKTTWCPKCNKVMGISQVKEFKAFQN